MGDRHQHFEDPMTWTRDIRKTKFDLLVFLLITLYIEEAETLKETLREAIMLLSFCAISVSVRRCFLAREEEGEAVHREEKQGPVWGKYREEADPCCWRQPEIKRGLEWESGLKCYILGHP